MTTVEFLAPDDGVFGGVAASTRPIEQRAATPFGGDDDDGPRRRGGPVLAIALAAAVVIGVVAVSPWSGDTPDPPPPTSTPPLVADADTARPGELPRLTPMGDPFAPPGSPVPATGGPRPARPPALERGIPWTFALPTGFSPTDAFVRPHSGGSGWFELWASPSAGRWSGRWIALHVAEGARQQVVPDAERVAFGDEVLLRWSSPDGVRHLQFDPNPGYDLRISAYGWSDDELLDLARTTTVVDGRPQYAGGGPRVDQLVVARPSAAFGLEEEWLAGDTSSFLELRDDSGNHLSLTVGTTQRDAPTVGRFVVTASSDEPMSGPDVRREVGSLNATVGRLPGFDGRNVVRWAVADVSFALAGHVPIDDLLGLADTVRPADDVEWDKIVYEVAAMRSTKSGRWTSAAGGDLSAGGSWAVYTNPADTMTSVFLGSAQATVEIPTGVIRFYATRQGTLAMARLDPGSGAVAMRTVPDLVVHPMVGLGDEVLGAAVVEDVGPLCVEVIDDADNVLFLRCAPAWIAGTQRLQHTG